MVREVCINDKTVTNAFLSFLGFTVRSYILTYIIVTLAK